MAQFHVQNSIGPEDSPVAHVPGGTTSPGTEPGFLGISSGLTGWYCLDLGRDQGPGFSMAVSLACPGYVHDWTMT